MGGAVSNGIDNDELIDNLVCACYIKSTIVEAVFRAVNRGDYFLPEYVETAYKDMAWKCGNIHISAPCIYSEAMENLNLGPGMSFLNIGSGTGYFSTMVGLILGPYGKNHGVEIHSDVIKYAYEKLDSFKKTSIAMDKFDFCEPIFVKGNALCLPSSLHQYDRIYCGAGCPENQVDFIKNLIKVGGILIMPINDQLLQITRISKTHWESKSVLPVTFATLQPPTDDDAKSSIVLPDSGTVSLQALCRFNIRKIIRANAEKEYPDLLKQISRKKRSPRRKADIIIPFSGSSDEEDDGGYVNPYFRRVPIIHGNNTLGAVFDFGMVREYPVGTSFVVQNCSRHTHDNTEGNSTSETDQTEEGRRPVKVLRLHQSVLPKREKFDSGISEDIVNCKELSSSSSSDDSDDEFMEVDSDVAETGFKDNSTKTTSKPELSYSSVMKAKIQDLPLPLTVKAYLNFYREF